MENWRIEIKGCGPHHNPNHENDAEKLASRFVQLLDEHGHSISLALFECNASAEGIVRHPEPPCGCKPPSRVPLLHEPAAHALPDLLRELKFGRPAAQQKWLDQEANRLETLGVEMDMKLQCDWPALREFLARPECVETPDAPPPHQVLGTGGIVAEGTGAM